MAKRYNESNLQSLTDRQIFFDANILLYLFWPTGSMEWSNIYSKIFNILIRNGNKMFVDFTVISEVVNKAIKTEYDKHCQINNTSKENFKYKDFRNSKSGVEAFNDIYYVVKKQILKHFEITGKAFTKLDIENLLTIDSLDFNDKAIATICSENNFVLLTNDSDFVDADVDILTENRKLFRN